MFTQGINQLFVRLGASMFDSNFVFIQIFESKQAQALKSFKAQEHARFLCAGAARRLCSRAPPVLGSCKVPTQIQGTPDLSQSTLSSQSISATLSISSIAMGWSALVCPFDYWAGAGLQACMSTLPLCLVIPNGREARKRFLQLARRPEESALLLSCDSLSKGQV